MAATGLQGGSLQDIKESKDYHFPTEEEAILAFWQQIDAFKEQLRRTEGKPEFSFYDGPPFATGLPHYGHLLAGTLKVRAAACGPAWGCQQAAAGNGGSIPVACLPAEIAGAASSITNYACSALSASCGC